MSGRVALVTGANKGIGRAVVQRLARLGMRVYLGARDEARGRAAERELAAAGDVRFVRLDVTDAGSVERVARRIERESDRLDVLVNNAGVGGPPTPPSETSAADVRFVHETNVLGVITVTNAVLPLLRRSPAGRIVNVSSVLGSLAHAAANADPTGVFPPGNFPVMLAYNTSKAALNAVTVTYANELRCTGILVNAVSPGFVATDANGHRGTLTPEQGARVPVLLATLGEDGPTAAFFGENGTATGQVLSW
ncbi:SDR family oxidoreductase [Saccharothrix obliqua]|uniref:SDR family oxidoreductase n=1 Tax=Saccharothrix obliqua TaxID=2861747 RepID=UPI0027E2B7BE|nr:SDR family oxidoreductase [Saccharothrix obliqua]